MYNKIKNILTILVLIVFIIGISNILFEKCNKNLGKGFKAKLDSLNYVTDSLQNVIKNNNGIIEILMVKDSILEYQIVHQKTKIKPIIKYVDSSKKAIDKFTDPQLVSFFNNRYSADTITNKLPLAQPVLNSAAKDLVEFDGAKKQLIIKDSIISLTENRISIKDSIIDKHVKNEINYRNIIINKDTALDLWGSEYSLLNNKYQKAKNKNKVLYIIIGGLTFLLLAK